MVAIKYQVGALSCKFRLQCPYRVTFLPSAFADIFEMYVIGDLFRFEFLFMFDLSFADILTVAFMAVTTLSLSAYLPQVWASLRDKKAREGTVVSTWWIWTVGALIEALYMAVVIESLLLVGIALFHLVACSVVAGAGTMEKWKYKHKKVLLEIPMLELGEAKITQKM